MRHLGKRLVLGGALLLAPFVLAPVALAQEDDLDGVLEGADLDSLSPEQLKKALDQPQQGPPPVQQQGPPPVQQQGPPRTQPQGPPRTQPQGPPTQQQGPPRTDGSGAEVYDDLSDVLDAVREPQAQVTDETQVRPSTPQAGQEIDRQVQQEVAPLAAQITAEQREWSQLSPEEQARRLEEARRSLREFADRVATEDIGMANALRRVADGGEGVSGIDSRSYGSPLSARRTYDPSGATGMGGDGSGQARWWEKLLATLVEGVAGGLKGYVATTRMNELKARADRLALRAGIENRPYVDARVRQAVGNSGLSQMGYDKRLDDLLLGGNRSGGPLRAEPAPTPVTDVGLSRGPSKPVPRLPRVRDPITGAERVQINMQLGADPRQPLMVSPR